MNALLPQTEIGRIRSIVARHALPAFVRGFDVHLGEYGGSPAFWVEFKVVPHADAGKEGVLARGDALVSLTRTLQPELLREIDDRYPFYRFLEVASDTPAE